MRIAATSDLHVDLDHQMNPGELERLRDRVHVACPDVFIIAGDLAG